MYLVFNFKIVLTIKKKNSLFAAEDVNNFLCKVDILYVKYCLSFYAKNFKNTFSGR